MVSGSTGSRPKSSPTLNQWPGSAIICSWQPGSRSGVWKKNTRAVDSTPRPPDAEWSCRRFCTPCACTEAGLRSLLPGDRVRSLHRLSRNAQGQPRGSPPLHRYSPKTSPAASEPCSGASAIWTLLRATVPHDSGGRKRNLKPTCLPSACYSRQQTHQKGRRGDCCVVSRSITNGGHHGHMDQRHTERVERRARH